ncbi:hypothetical protein V2J09_014641 [Rumex salicifolius]
MGEHEESKVESIIEKIEEKLHSDSSSSSSDSDDDKPVPSLKSKIYRLFGREKPVHKVLGGGKPADILLWRDKKISAGILGGVTAIWFLFEVFEYHLLSFICHALILSLVILFLWSNASNFISKAPPRIPDVLIPEGSVLRVVSTLTYDINHALASVRHIATGKDLKKFLSVIAGLWFFSILSSCFNFLTLFYISFLLLHTLPVMYEKNEDQVDAFGEKAMAEFNKHYVVFVQKVLSKIPLGPFQDKKRA